jgi:hypothetical protein
MGSPQAPPPATEPRPDHPEPVNLPRFVTVSVFDGSARGARLLYEAMTRAVQVLHFVTDAPLPAALGP